MGRAKSELEIGLTVAGKADIPGMKVVWQNSHGACADINCKSIYLPRAVTCTGTPVEVVALVRGLFHHEKGHIRRSTVPKKPGALGLIQNAVEDVWMEWAEARESGAGLNGIFNDKARYYAKKIAKDQSKSETSGPALWEATVAMMGHARSVPPTWKLSEKAQKYFDAANTVFQTSVVECEDSHDCLALARVIYDLLKDALKEDKQDKQDDDSSEEPGQDSGGSDDSDSSSSGGGASSEDEDEDDELENGSGSCGSDDEDETDDDSSDETSGGGTETDDEDDDEDDETFGGSGDEGDEDAGSDADEDDTGSETDDESSDESGDDDTNEGDDESGSDTDDSGSDTDDGSEGDDEDDGASGADDDMDEGKSAGGTDDEDEDDGFDEDDDGDLGKMELGDDLDTENDPDLSADDGDDDTEGSQGDSDDDTEGSQVDSDTVEGGSTEPTDEELEAELEADADGEVKDYTDYVNEDLEKLLSELDPADLEYTSLKDNDVHEMAPDAEVYREMYRTLHDSVSGSSRKVDAALMLAVQALTNQYPIRGLRTGSIDVNRMALLSGGLSQNVFCRVEQDDFSLEGTEIMFVVDNSYSMSGRSIVEVKKWLVAVGDALDKLNVKFGIVGTTTGHNVPLNGFTRTKPIWFTHYKLLDESWRCSAPRLVTMSGQNNNVDGEAVEWASYVLSQRKNNRRIVISVCDGEPYSGQGDCKSGETVIIQQAMAENITRVCDVWRPRGVEIYDVAIGTDKPAKYYGEDYHIRFESGTDFSPEALRHFAGILIQGRMAIH